MGGSEVTQDRPSAPELLDAVAEYLFAELRPEVAGEQRFRVLVAANVCAIVARELRAGEAPAREDLALFESLLGTDDAEGAPTGAELSSLPDLNSAPEGQDAADAARQAAVKLAALLRSGELDDRIEEIAPRLAEHVKRQLDVARPGYADG